MRLGEDWASAKVRVILGGRVVVVVSGVVVVVAAVVVGGTVVVVVGVVDVVAGRVVSPEGSGSPDPPNSIRPPIVPITAIARNTATTVVMRLRTADS
jgi:hypothetical protein